tara:strand:- start:191 stop:634 length:444 start_codon:yes stop_codon:yes gene_type:complete
MIPEQYIRNCFPQWSQMSVRLNDMDALSHVNNALLKSYYEEARIQILQKIPEWFEDIVRKNCIILRKSVIEYHSPTLYSDIPFNCSNIVRVNASLVYVLQAAYNSKTEQLGSIAEFMGTWFDLQKQRHTYILSSKMLSNYFLSSSPN